MKTKCMSCGGTTKKMQKGGSVDGPMEARRKIMGEKIPSTKKTLKYVKKNGSGLILKDKSKFPEGIYKPTMQTGGFPITAKAAARKVAKGKGMMTYNYGTKDVPGSDGNKGAYVKFAKNQEPNPYGGKTLQGRSRRVMQKGGVKK